MDVKRMLSILCLSGALCLLCGCDYLEERKANSLREQGKFDEAREIYTQLIEKGNNISYRLLACDYDEAAAAYAAGDYLRAIELYEGLGPYYSDCAELLQRANYDYALQLKEDGDLAGAHALFAGLGDYEDSAALAQECAASFWEDPQAGGVLFFGSFEQDGDEANGPEPIQWRVLAREGDYVLLTTEHVLHRMEYGEANEWERSDVRAWLNGEFYDAAFSREEQGRVQAVYTYAELGGPEFQGLRQDLAQAYPDDPAEAQRILMEYIVQHGGELDNVFGDDWDRVFLLSAQEARELFSDKYDRESALTEAAGTGTRLIDKVCGWWTRSRTTSGVDQVVVAVDYDGDIDSVQPSRDSGVRPTVCLSLSGQPSEKAMDLEVFGFPSSTDLYETAAEPRGSSSGPCPACNGTGTIRFYYGSSDLEAILSGHDPYTLGTCPMCNGRG